MKTLGRWLLIFALPATLAVAQDTTQREDRAAAISRTAYLDIGVLRVLNTLGLTAEQALRWLPIVRDLQAKQAELDHRVETLEKAISADLIAYRAALLRNRTVTQVQAANIIRLRELEAQVADELDDAVAEAMKQALGFLTPTQQQLVGGLETGVEPVTESPDEIARRQAEQMRRLQAIYVQVRRFMSDARDERDPRRFQTLAPGACRDQVTALTGLLPEDPLHQRLTRYFLEQITLIFRMKPIEYRQNGEAIAVQLAQATQYVIAQKSGSTGVGTEQISADRLRAALTYERLSDLLLQLTKFRPKPFDE